MSYKIQYKPTVKMEKNIRYFLKNHKQGVACTIGTVFLLLLLVRFDMVDALREFIIPGDAEVTKTAFSELGNDLKDGVGVKDALTAFCLEIIENANIAE